MLYDIIIHFSTYIYIYIHSDHRLFAKKRYVDIVVASLRTASKMFGTSWLVEVGKALNGGPEEGQVGVMWLSSSYLEGIPGLPIRMAL